MIIRSLVLINLLALYASAQQTSGSMTPLGDALGGTAEATQAQGQADLLDSSAAINLQLAKKQALENEVNRMKLVRAYHQKQLAPQDASPRYFKHEPDEWVRLAHSTIPQRLPKSALNPDSGSIEWPMALRDPIFQLDRKRLESLFAKRARNQGVLDIHYRKAIHETIDAITDSLKDQIRTIDSRTYLEARSFLKSLAFECTLADN